MLTIAGTVDHAIAARTSVAVAVPASNPPVHRRSAPAPYKEMIAKMGEATNAAKLTVRNVC